MRRLLPVLALLVACGGHRLPVEPEHLSALNKIAGSYPNEIGACLAPDSLEIPHTRRAGRDRLSPAPCERGTRVYWHAHPKELIYSPTDGYSQYVREVVPDGRSMTDPRGLCYLSGADIRSIIEASYRNPDLEYAVVGVEPGIWCYWTIAEVRQAGIGRQFLAPRDDQVSWRAGY